MRVRFDKVHNDKEPSRLIGIENDDGTHCKRAVWTRDGDEWLVMPPPEEAEEVEELRKRTEIYESILRREAMGTCDYEIGGVDCLTCTHCKAKTALDRKTNVGR